MIENKEVQPLPSPKVPHKQSLLQTKEKPAWIMPFASMYARIRYSTYLLMAALILVLIESYFVFSMATKQRYHVIAVHDDGQAVHRGVRFERLAPRPHEALYVAKQFIETFYTFNSSTVHLDIAKALGLCSHAMQEQFRKELAHLSYIEIIRKRQIRSEVTINKATIIDTGTHHFKIAIQGFSGLFPVTSYEQQAQEIKPFHVELLLQAVPRNHTTRINGLEIVRLIHVQEPDKKDATKH